MAKVKIEYLGGPKNGEVIESFHSSLPVYYDGEWYEVKKRPLAYFYRKNGYAEYVVIHKERQ